MSGSWMPDPVGRHQERWHDGTAWTGQVRDRGVVNTDATGLEPTAVPRALADPGESAPSGRYPTAGVFSSTPAPQPVPVLDPYTPLVPAASVGFASAPGAAAVEPPPYHAPSTPYLSPAAYPAASTVPRSNGFAVAALLTGIIGASVLAVVFGALALSQIKDSEGRQSGRGMAIAGIVLGIVWTIAWIAIYLAIAVWSASLDSGY